MSNAPLAVAVVGAGLAGSVAALALAAAGHRVTLIGPGSDGPKAATSASAAAAGVFNPLTGRGPQLTWQAPTLWAYLEAFYPLAERLTGGRFYHPMPVWRPLLDAGEAGRWARSVGQIPPGWAYPHAEPASALGGQRGLLAPAGVARTLAAGYVDVPAFLAAVRGWLGSRAGAAAGHAVYDRMISLPDALSPTEQGWQISVPDEKETLTVDRIILCPGAGGGGCGWFDTPWLAPLKGEGLWLESPRPLVGRPMILNRASLLVPQLGKEGLYWAGSTYEHHVETPEPTDEGRTSILARIGAYLPDVARWRLLDHQAGVRPSTRHRRPVLLEYGVHPGLWLMTGLGTKGVSLAPWVASVLVRAFDGSPHPVGEGEMIETLMNPPTPVERPRAGRGPRSSSAEGD